MYILLKCDKYAFKCISFDILNDLLNIVKYAD